MFPQRAPTRLLVPAVPALAFLLAGQPAESATFLPVGNMALNRAQVTATTLINGRVLIVGGNSFDRRAELYDGLSAMFLPAGNLTVARSGQTSTLLQNGKVLIAGGASLGTPVSSAELYDPATGFSPTGSMSIPRTYATATLLTDGRVLVAGGTTGGHPFNSLDTAELYDPVSGTFSPTANTMMEQRQNHTATLLDDGRVLIVGGFGPATFTAVAGAEIFDPVTRTFSPTGGLAFGRGEHSATRLPDGTVLVAGGFNAFPGDGLASAELYDPAAGGFGATGSLDAKRGGHSATLLPDGTVLVAGGFANFPVAPVLAGAEVYDPSSHSFSPTASMNGGRARHGSAMLPDGQVLVVGGQDANANGLNTAEVYFDQATAAKASLVHADATADGVDLLWQLGDATPGPQAVLYKSAPAPGWNRVAVLTADGAGRLEYVDRDVVAGGRYGYRLSIPEDGVEQIVSETWVDVPLVPRLAIAGVRFTPAAHALRVSFVLPDARSAQLDLLDIEGRRLAAREVGSLGSGAHTADLTGRTELRSGVYLVRLRTDSRALVAKCVVAR
jgi:Galactose oxidase, central domain